MIAGLRGHDRPVDTGQQLLGLGQRQSQVHDVVQGVGPADLHHVDAVSLAMAPVSINRTTHAIYDAPAGSGPTGHTGPVPIPPISGHSPERLIRTLKENLLWVRSFATVAELVEAIREFRLLYNEQLLIERHGYRSPSQVRRERQAATRAVA
jgi:hypothetical protein